MADALQRSQDRRVKLETVGWMVYQAILAFQDLPDHLVWREDLDCRGSMDPKGEP